MSFFLCLVNVSNTASLYLYLLFETTCLWPILPWSLRPWSLLLLWLLLLELCCCCCLLHLLVQVHLDASLVVQWVGIFFGVWDALFLRFFRLGIFCLLSCSCILMLHWLEPPGLLSPAGTGTLLQAS